MKQERSSLFGQRNVAGATAISRVPAGPLARGPGKHLRKAATRAVHFARLGPGPKISGQNSGFARTLENIDILGHHGRILVGVAAGPNRKIDGWNLALFHR